MLEIKIPNNIPKIIEPKIPFTKIPNPIGPAIVIYDNGDKKIIDFYYFQKAVHYIVKITKYFFCKVRLKTLRNKYFKEDK